MSEQVHQIKHLICPSCDAEPPADLGSNVCPSCGARLVAVQTGDDSLVGTVIDDRFELRARLGEGGMGTVYRAWQRSIGREVAIKLIDQRFLRDVMAVRRFLREARLASQLSQPNTVSVFDVGQCDDGRLFIAMELIRGRNLDQVLGEDGPMNASRAARIGVQLCDALVAAHQLQIVHRDLKLANVMLLADPPGRDLVKVLDFGLAKSLVDDESHKTQSGLVVGTPRYMAPELATGGSASPVSDLYALGVMLGELTTGRDLWPATTFTALIGQKLSGSAVLADVPAPLRTLVGRLIEPEPKDRPQTAAAVREMLLEVTGDASAPDRAALSSGETVTLKKPDPVSVAPTVALPSVVTQAPPPRSRSRAGIYAIAIAGIVVVAGLVIYFATRGGAAASSPPDAAPMVRAHVVAPDAGVKPPPAPTDAAPPPPPPDAAPAVKPKTHPHAHKSGMPF